MTVNMRSGGLGGKTLMGTRVWKWTSSTRMNGISSCPEFWELLHRRIAKIFIFNQSNWKWCLVPAAPSTDTSNPIILCILSNMSVSQLKELHPEWCRLSVLHALIVTFPVLAWRECSCFIYDPSHYFAFLAAQRRFMASFRKTMSCTWPWSLRRTTHLWAERWCFIVMSMLLKPLQ